MAAPHVRLDLLAERHDLLELGEVAGGDFFLGVGAHRTEEGAHLPVGEARERPPDRADERLLGVGLDDAELDQLLRQAQGLDVGLRERGIFLIGLGKAQRSPSLPRDVRVDA